MRLQLVGESTSQIMSSVDNPTQPFRLFSLPAVISSIIWRDPPWVTTMRLGGFSSNEMAAASPSTAGISTNTLGFRPGTNPCAALLSFFQTLSAARHGSPHERARCSKPNQVVMAALPLTLN